MDMVIISVITDKGTLIEQYLVEEAEGMKLFMGILKGFESLGFNVRGGDIAKLYEDGFAELEKLYCKLLVYVKTREV